MRAERLREILQAVSAGRITPGEAERQLASLPFEDLGFAHVDTHRALRTGMPEVIFGQGKHPEQIVAIAERIVENGGPLLATRLDGEAARALAARFPAGVHDPMARTFHLEVEPVPVNGAGTVLVVSAGTSDMPVAAEAALAARLMGSRVEQLCDVGVAGIHRLFQYREQLLQARVLIVVAGMEGALPSVVGGLVERPIVAVPTSVGYGASFGGLAALLGMLNSCAPGVCVVNIDNGFGAGVVAALINRPIEERAS
ncbi:MAG: nickel pincer cofactor biosynthesis protein LarB [Deltaproteobacteria bacterium]|nr:nickel pincer cofactor biosynthesis protein LarB [Deltaproteobacteria bacterium]